MIDKLYPHNTLEEMKVVINKLTEEINGFMKEIEILENKISNIPKPEDNDFEERIKQLELKVLN